MNSALYRLPNRARGQAIALPWWGVPFNKVDDPRYRLTTEHNTAQRWVNGLNSTPMSAKWVLLDL
jgi:hypothetical protein